MRGSDFDTGLGKSGFNPVDAALKDTDALHERVNLPHPLQRPFVDRRYLTSQFLDLIPQFIEFTHILRRSFASLGDRRSAVVTRSATILTLNPISRNRQMENAMSGPRRFVPERAEVIDAYQMVTRPQEFIGHPDFEGLMRRAWKVLLADRQMRIEARRARDAIESIFPGDAA